MSSETSPGKKDPVNLPTVQPATSRAGLSAAIQAVANAPVQIFTYSSSGRSKV